LLLEGGEFVLVVSFSLIKMNETPISNAQSMAELMSLFSTVPRRFFDSDRMIKVCNDLCTRNVVVVVVALLDRNILSSRSMWQS
jgi:hypothetical protein